MCQFNKKHSEDLVLSEMVESINSMKNKRHILLIPIVDMNTKSVLILYYDMHTKSVLISYYYYIGFYISILEIFR